MDEAVGENMLAGSSIMSRRCICLPGPLPAPQRSTVAWALGWAWPPAAGDPSVYCAAKIHRPELAKVIIERLGFDFLVVARCDAKPKCAIFRSSRRSPVYYRRGERPHALPLHSFYYYPALARRAGRHQPVG